MVSKRTVLTILVFIFIAIVLWQGAEHKRFVNSGKNAILYRAQDITNTIAVVVRSQRMFGFVIQPRLEAALKDLVNSKELISIILFNANGEIVCSAGEEIESDLTDITESGVIWDNETVTIVNPVDLGVDQSNEFYNNPTVIVSHEDRELLRKMRPPRPPQREDDDDDGGPPYRRGDDDRGPPRYQRDDSDKTISGASPEKSLSSEQEDDNEHQERFGGRREDDRLEDRRFSGRPDSATSDYEKGSSRRGGPEHWKDFRRRIGRPPFMDRDEYKTLLQKSGLHGFVIKMSRNQNLNANINDIWMRLSIIGFAFIAILGFWFAWRNLLKSSDLKVRLVRASEMNTHLREMNFAAAGLAHETRNPLNLVRGIAQLIAKNNNTNPEVRNNAIKITTEVDRVTAQLNEFINYSKPREPKPNPVQLESVVRDVERALKDDMDEKNIEFQIDIPDLTIEADESLLRQVLFNLLLNSIQAVDMNGTIKVYAENGKMNDLTLTIQDNGPGVPDDIQDKIFSPYITTREEGSGLGLAVVKQIISAHGWEIMYLPSNQHRATFSISGINLSQKG